MVAHSLDRPWNEVVSSGQKKKDKRHEFNERSRSGVHQSNNPPPPYRKRLVYERSGNSLLTSKPNHVRLTGTRKEIHTLKAVKRTGDVFVGRVETSVSVEDMTEYIKDNFEVNPLGVELLKIKTDRYVAFKITLNLSERDKLFNSDLWPEDLIVDKFYSNRSSRP